MIKKNYKRIAQKQYFSPYTGRFVNRYSDHQIGKYQHKYSWDRRVHTFNEIRQNEHAKADGYKVRWKRSKRGLPTYYDDPNIARTWGRSWKDYTKRRKQWQ